MANRELRDPPERFFEDFALGDRLVTRRRTIEASDFSNFAALTGDFYPLHIDEVGSAETRFGTRIGHGPLTFTYAVGLVGLSNWYGDAVVALKEITGLKALLPVRSGDTLHVVATVEEVDGSRSPKYGTIGVRYSVQNQLGEEVMTFLQTMLTKKKPA